MGNNERSVDRFGMTVGEYRRDQVLEAEREWKASLVACPPSRRRGWDRRSGTGVGEDEMLKTERFLEALLAGEPWAVEEARRRER